MPLLIHIGTARTATTGLQSQVFPRCIDNIYIGKTPYRGTSIKPRLGVVNKILPSLSILITTQEGTRLICDYLISEAIALSACNMQHAGKFKPMVNFLQELLKLAKHKPVLISSERLCDTSASLCGVSRFNKNFVDSNYPIFPLIKAANLASIYPQVIVCFRNYRDYLLSKYLRTCSHRQEIGLGCQSAYEYLLCQSTLEGAFPGSSIFLQVFHKTFIKKLQKGAFLHCLSMKELLNSRDVFHTLGISESVKIDFAELTKENESSISVEAKQKLLASIDNSLLSLGLTTAIHEQQMFDNN